VAVATGLSLARNLAWILGGITRVLRLRPKEPPIFDVEWRFYDAEPGEGNAVGVARFGRTWRRGVQGKWARMRERSAPRDTRHGYEGKGFLRDRKLVLNWVADDRPDTFGVLFVTVNEDCREMKGFTILTPQNTGVTEANPIWFRR